MKLLHFLGGIKIYSIFVHAHDKGNLHISWEREKLNKAFPFFVER